MRPCSEMPYQWRQKDFKQYVLCKSAQSDYLAYLTCIAIRLGSVSGIFLKELKNDALHLFIMLFIMLQS